MMIMRSLSLAAVVVLLTTTSSAAEQECNRVVAPRLNYFGQDGERRIPAQVRCASTSAVVLSEDTTGNNGGGGRKLGGDMGKDSNPGQSGEQLPIPFPTHGSFHQLGNAIHFRHLVAPAAGAQIADLNCFHFSKADGNHDVFSVCDGDDDRIHFTALSEGGSASAGVEMQMTGLQAGKWVWWAEDSMGTETEKYGFTIVSMKPSSVPGTNNAANANANAEAGGDDEEEPASVEEAEWTKAGTIQGATGRIYYESNGYDYACTGTVIRDAKSGRSLVLTAAHCVWDDLDEIWGSNVIFIPNRDAIQTDLTAGDIKRQCEQDICGCWTLSAGVVHSKWKSLPWPDRLQYDYGLYVVDDEGMHQGTDCGGTDALDEAVDEMEFVVGIDLATHKTHSLGYSLEHNPDFRYCLDETAYRQPPGAVDAASTNTYWLTNCGLTGGASGGPWVMDMDQSTGKGKIVSVNSWSLSDISGMGGPIIDASEARCLVNEARKLDFKAIYARPKGEQGEFITHCHNRECITREEAEAAQTENQLSRRLSLRGSEEESFVLPPGRRLCEEKQEQEKQRATKEEEEP